MRFAPVYWNEAEPAGETLDQLLYRLRRLDADDGLIFDSLSLDDLMELSEETLMLDALMTTRVLLDRKMIAMERVMNAASQALDVTASQISPPFKRQGVINVAAIFELSDGQTISVVFHNPDAKNVKSLKPSDDLISWKWLLNKRDVTIAVAPEKGEDLPIRLVARRLMLLAEKNSGAFQRLNQKRAARLENIEALKGEIKGLEIELDRLTKDINVARLEAEERAINPPAVEPEPTPEPTVEPTGDPGPDAIPDNPYWSVMTLTERARVLATLGLVTKTGRPSVRAKAFAGLIWKDLPDDIRAKLSQHPAISAEPDPGPIPDPVPTDETDITPDAIARVDAAYPFANATDEFKAWVADSVDAAQGPFATARAMEERAKTHGASIEWGFFGGAALDSVYVEDDEDDEDLPPDPNTIPLFDAASEHWKQQPRDRKTGRWALRRAKRAKQAVSGLIDKALKAAQKVAHHARIHRGGEAMKGDPLLTAMGELTGALDSAAILDAARPAGAEYVGKIRKDGEIVGRADIDDEGWAMVYMGVLGDARVVIPNTGRRPAQRLRDNAAASLIDWAFHAESSSDGPDLNREDFLKAFSKGRFDQFSAWEGYAEAAKEFLEGDIENVKRPKKRLEFKMEALADLDGAIKPKPISKAIRVAKTPEDRLKAAMQIAGNKDVRYYLNGVKVEDGRLAATDGHRLVVVKTDTSAWDHLRPQAADKDPDEYVDDGVIIGRDGKLIDGRFPEIERVIPQQKSTDRVGEFDAEKLAARARGIAKAFKLTDEVYPGITLVIGDREVGVNANYLLDMAETFLRFGYKTFSMQEPGANSGILALSPDGKVTQVVMPMHDPKPSPFAPIGSETEVGNDQAWREWTNREAAPAPAPEPQPEPMPEPVSIPDVVKRDLTQPFQELIKGLERGRATDRQFNGGGRYAAEVWLNMDMGEALKRADEQVAARIAAIPDATNRASAQAYADANRPDFSLTTKEQEWLDSFNRKRKPVVEPEPATPDLAEIAARLIAGSDPNRLRGGGVPTAEDLQALGLRDYEDYHTLYNAMSNLFPELSEKNLRHSMKTGSYSGDDIKYDSRQTIEEAARIARVFADRETKKVAKTKNFAPANAKTEPKGTRVEMDGRWSSRLTEALAAATGTGVSTGRSAGKMQGEVHTADEREFKGHGALGKYLLEKLNGMIERGEPVDLEPIRQATYAGGGVNPFEIVGPTDLGGGNQPLSFDEILAKARSDASNTGLTRTEQMMAAGQVAGMTLTERQDMGDLYRQAGVSGMVERHSFDTGFAEGVRLRQDRESGQYPPAQGQTPADPQKDADRAFLQSVIDGGADFYDAAITDRLASIAESYADDPEIDPLIQQAKTAAKNWFVAEFKRKTEGMAV